MHSIKMFQTKFYKNFSYNQLFLSQSNVNGIILVRIIHYFVKFLYFKNVMVDIGVKIVIKVLFNDFVYYIIFTALSTVNYFEKFCYFMLLRFDFGSIFFFRKAIKVNFKFPGKK